HGHPASRTADRGGAVSSRIHPDGRRRPRTQTDGECDAAGQSRCARAGSETLTDDPSEIFTLRRCALLGAMLVGIAALRIVATYTPLSHTVDEPIHLGAGMEWLDHGTMTGDVSHPPMARVLSAIGPWLPAGPRGGCPNPRGGGDGVAGSRLYGGRLFAPADGAGAFGDRAVARRGALD